MARYTRAYGDSDLKREEKKREKAAEEQRERDAARKKALATRTSGAADMVARVLASRTGSTSTRLDPNTLMRAKTQAADLDRRTNVGGDSPLNDIPEELSHEDYEKEEVKTAYTALEEARHAAFKKQREKEKADYLDAVDGDYWLLVCFCTKRQRDAFVEATGWKEERFVEGSYIDGVGLAKDMGIELPVPSLRFYGSKEDGRLVSEVGIIPPKVGKRR